MVGYAQLRAWRPDALEASARSWRRVDADLASAAERLRREVAAPLRRHGRGDAAVPRALALADSLTAHGRRAARLAAELSRAATELSAARADLDAAVAEIEAHGHLRISSCGDVSVRSLSELHRDYPELDVGALVSVSVTASDSAERAQDRVDRALRRATACDTAAAVALRGLLEPAAGPGARPPAPGVWNVRFEAAAGLGAGERRSPPRV